MPASISEQADKNLKTIVADPAVMKQIENQGAHMMLTPPAEFRDFLASELKK